MHKLDRIKRVAAIHDISGVGKCSLTVALPIISAAGAECACLPTAVLSTHTGGFEGFTFRDLTDDMLPTALHWQREGFTFDAFYSGYLGSLGQIDIVKEIFGMFKNSSGGRAFTIVDPVMADHGRLYSRFTLEHVAGMKGLCSCADLLVPNRTEAAFMLGSEYRDGVQTEQDVKTLLHGLTGLGAKQVVLTGVQFNEAEVGAACLDAESGQIDYHMNRLIPGMYHGTGDVFGSFLTGALVRGKPLPEAMGIAVDFTCAAIELTEKEKTPPRMGVRFEAVLGEYGRRIDK